jgi:DNA-binding transcriptional LysR family regulator
MAIFCSVAEHSSFAAAARAMNMTPPAAGLFNARE